jgi:cytochrome b561
MPQTARAVGYSPLGKTLHWIIAALVIAQFVVSILMPDIGPRTGPSKLVDLHLSLGILIFGVMAIRLAHRLVHTVPLEMAGSPQWERRSAMATHVLMYAILIVAPFLGWASASAHSVPVTLFGLFNLPDIAAPRARWALKAGDVHTVAMWTLLALVVLHVLAALYHHFVRNDGVLRRMLPRASEAGSA